MADIKIFDLEKPAGLEFFESNEGYLDDLSEDENAWGGDAPNVVISVDNDGPLSVISKNFVSASVNK